MSYMIMLYSRSCSFVQRLGLQCTFPNCTVGNINPYTPRTLAINTLITLGPDINNVLD